MSASLRFLCSKGRAKRVHLAQSHRGGFDIELAGLRKIRLLVEIIDRKQSRRPLARRWSKNWRVGQHEAAIVKEIPGSFDNFCTGAQNCSLTWRSNPEMALVHQEIDAMFFERNRERIVFGNTLQHPNIRYVELIAP